MPCRAALGSLVFLGVLAGCGPTERNILGPIEPEVAGAARRTEPEENLEALARLYGYIRWFHPTDAAAGADWRELAAAGVADVRDAETTGELRERLAGLYGPLAPQMDLWIEGEPEPEGGPRPHRAEQVYWQHQGYVGTRLDLYAPPYGRSRVGAEGNARRRFAEEPTAGAAITTELAPGLHLRLPMVLTPRQADHDIDAGALVSRDLARAARSANGWTDLDVRQGAVIEVWNVFRHFYPYQDAVPIDWPGLLERALEDAVDDDSVDDAAATLWGLVHALEDGHGLVGHREIAARRHLPIRVELIDGKPTVTATADPERFALGDVIVSIDGHPMSRRIDALVERLSGSPQWRRLRAAGWESLSGRNGNPATVVLDRGGREHAVIARYTESAPPPRPRPSEIHRFADGVMYVDLTRATWEAIEAALPELAAAPAVVFDMRGYPNHTHHILRHLLRQPEATKWMQVPRIVEPDGRIAGWHPIGWDLEPAEPQIAGKVAFLMDAEAVSYGESVLAYVEAHDLGALVGSATAGANGDIVRVDTLGGFFVVFTGMKVTRHDGSRLHGAGVQPTIAVTPTRHGLVARRDEVLERGLAEVRVGLGHLARRSSRAR
jgi:C-terminal processing protease CtpA/Prc